MVLMEYWNSCRSLKEKIIFFKLIDSFKDKKANNHDYDDQQHP